MEINLGDVAFDIDFHPSDQLVATPLISGYLQVYRYASGSVPQRVVDVPAHNKSCRAARFINSGQAILTGSKDRSIVETDLETGSMKTFYENAHKKGINKLINLDEYTIATGDYGGCIKVWDIRQRSHCNKFKAHRAFISDLAFAADSRRVLGTSGDGTLSICNLRMNKHEAKSQLHEEPQSVVIVKNGTKVVCSSNEGTLFLFSQDGLEDSSNRFLGFQPYSIEAMLKLDEDRIIAGSETGLISLVGILPNRIIQPIADHSENILGLGFSHDKKFLGSVADDEMLKLWDMDAIVTQDSGKTTADDMDVDSNLPKSGKGTKKKNAGKRNVMCSPNVFADLEIDG